MFWKALWASGLMIALIGELGAVFSEPLGDTITEQTFNAHPIAMVLMGAFILWSAYHFLIAKGEPTWIDLVPVVIGGVVGFLAKRRGHYRSVVDSSQDD